MFLSVSIPPSLPAFLASKYNLKPIINPPTDDQLKSIHAAIRAAKDASKLGELLPELNSSVNLVSDLEDYLFDAQMARYRSTHGFILSPKELVYYPPTLPDHITNTVTLQPITGPPSNGELKLVALANRTCEGFSNTSLFDADLEMNLSQHLFDLRLARYVQRVTETHNSSSSYTSKQRTAIDPEPINHPADRQAQACDLESHSNPLETSPSTGTNSETNESKSKDLPLEDISIQRGISCLDQSLNSVGAHLCKTNDTLAKLADSISTIGAVLINTQMSDSRFQNGAVDKYNNLQQMLNHQGELPWSKGLPLLYKNWEGALHDPGDHTLAQYLQFYDIGSQFLVPDSNEPALIPEKKADALNTLRNWVM